MQRLANTQSDDLHDTSVMTCSKEDKERVRAILAEAVTQIRELIRNSKDEVACHYSKDLYSI